MKFKCTIKKTKRAYPTYQFKTEKQFARFLYETFGEGRYIALSNKKGGKSGFYVFWKGTVNSDGWIFETQDYMKRQLKWIEKEIEKASEEDVDFWESERSQAKEELSKMQKPSYGFGEILTQSGKRGVLHFWDESPIESQKKVYDHKGKRKKMEDMSIDELNDF